MKTLTRAAILAIGDELIAGDRLDTNSQWLSSRLAAFAVETIEHRTVDDDRVAVAKAITDLAGAADLLIMTGGLGPTQDDLTREALGDVVTPGQPLVEDPAARRHLEAIYRRRPGGMPPSNLSQTLRPEGAAIIENPNGTAPGINVLHNGCRIMVLPGPPREMKPMFEAAVVPLVRPEQARASTGVVSRSAATRAYGIGESAAAERITGLMARGQTLRVGTTVTRSILTATVRGRGPANTIDPAIASTLREIQSAWHPYAFDPSAATLAAATVAALREAGATLATAESCTAGLVGAAITDVAGASDVYLGGWVTYANSMKADRLGVPADVLASAGAVSAEVAGAMARGARERSGATCAVAITGIAGPGGGSDEKPVGTVWIAVVGPGDHADIRRFRFRGDRDEVRDRAAKSAVQQLRFGLLGVDDGLLWEVERR